MNERSPHGKYTAQIDAIYNKIIN